MPQLTLKSNLEFPDSISLPTIQAKDFQFLNSPFTTKETMDVIWELPENKSPGPDDFSSEYYKLLSTILAPHLENVYNAAV